MSMIPVLPVTKRWLKSILLLVMLLAANTSFATHFACGEIYADYIGSGPGNFKYKVTLVVLKDCQPGASNLTDQEVVLIQASSISFSKADTVNVRTNDTVDQLCPMFSQQNSCRTSGSSLQGYVRRVYTDTVIIPAAATDLTFSWANGARTIATVNMPTVGGANIYIACGINNTVQYNASTPRYASSIPSYVCVNQPDHFYNQPLSLLPDSLVTRNTAPQSGANTDISYVNPYTVANPVGSTTGYTMDTRTGVASFTPPTTGKFVLSFKTTSYNRTTHAAIAWCTRDVNLVVLPATQPFPSINDTLRNVTGGIQTAPAIITVRANTPLAFDVDAFNPGGTGITNMNADNTGAATGSSFSYSGTTGHFSWTPGTTDVGTHLFTVSVTDANCTPAQPIVGYAKLPITILVQPALAVDSFGVPAVSVFPNPARDIIHFTGIGKVEKAEVIDLSGRVVIASESKPGSQIDISSLSNGMYLLRLYTKDSRSIVRFTKK